MVRSNDMDDWVDAEFPTPSELLLENGLYHTIELSEGLDDLKAFRKLLVDSYHLDVFCIDCNLPTVFKRDHEVPVWTIANPQNRNFEEIRNDRVFDLYFHCSRMPSHRLVFQFILKDGKLTKIGQYPSIADLKIPEIAKYRRLLKDKYKELATGIGLASHGVGIGSFVYLRRIFEHLIEEAIVLDRQHPEWNEDDFKRLRMDEKIQRLSMHLPSFLVENRAFYGILSKGIHELEEQECLDCFDTVRAVVSVI